MNKFVVIFLLFALTLCNAAEWSVKTMNFATVIFLLFALTLCNAAEWSVKTMNFATVSMSIAFVNDKKGIAPVSDNGQGSAVLVTNDGGSSWNPAPAVETMLYMGGSAQGNSAVVSDMFSLYFSNELDGSYRFNKSLFLDGITSQNVEAFEGTYYAAAGESVLGGNGVAVSADNGEVFQFIKIHELKTDSRYGAYPSKDVWYISAGEWPENNNVEGHHLTSRIAIKNKNGVNSAYFHPGSTSNNTFKAQIVKTTDGGKTWTSVFYQLGFYFNQISCSTTENCVAVGEADAGAEAGVRIFATDDGGKTWKRTYFDSDPTMSLMAASFVGDKEVWVGGGHLVETDFKGYFFNSMDGGFTWKNYTVAGVYPSDFSFLSADHGYATGFNYMETSSLLEYK